MSIQAKQLLTKDIKEHFDEFLLKADSEKAIETVNTALANYDVEEVDGGYDAESKELLTAYLQAKEIEGRSQKTLNRYSYMLEKMITGIGAPITKVTVFHVRTYLMSERKRGLSDASLEGVRSIMSAFFGWLLKEGLIKLNPMANIGTIKCQKQVKEPFSRLEIELIKQACETCRERAIVSFLQSTGCRIGEVCRLDKEDIDLQTFECKVLGKGNKERIVYFSPVTAMELERYFKERTDSDPCLFAGVKGRLTEQGMRAFLKRIEKRCGVPNIHPHRFRRTLATNLIDRGMAIQEVAYILGHDNLNTTMKYVYIEQSNVKSAYQRYSA